MAILYSFNSIDSFFSLDGEHHPALFVIMPSGSHWKLRGIPPNSQERMKVRLPLPLAWAGLSDEELKNVTETNMKRDEKTATDFLNNSFGII